MLMKNTTDLLFQFELLVLSYGMTMLLLKLIWPIVKKALVALSWFLYDFILVRECWIEMDKAR